MTTLMDYDSSGILNSHHVDEDICLNSFQFEDDYTKRKYDNNDVEDNSLRRQHKEEEYKNLIQNFTSLQMEVETLKLQLSKIQSENGNLRNENSSLEKKLTTLQKRYDDMKVKVMENIDCSTSLAVTKRENELNSVEVQWRRLVEKERKEIEDGRNEYLKQVKEIENIRCQIRKDVERECDEQYQSLTKERDEWEGRYHEIKRNHDLMEVKTKVSLDTMTKELESVRKSREVDVSVLQEALSNHMDATSDSTNQLDQMHMELSEAKAVIETLTSSERELRKTLDDVRNEWKNEECLKNDTISTYEVELTKLRSSLAAKEAERQSMKTELVYLKRALEDANLSLKGMKDELSSERETVQSLTSQLEEREDKMAHLKEDLKVEQQRLSAELQTELMILKQENTTISKQKSMLERELVDNRAQLKQLKSDNIVYREASRREMDSSINNVTLENTKLQEKIVEIRSKLKQTEAELTNVSSTLKHVNEVHNHEIQMITKEKDVYEKNCSFMNESINELKQQYRDIHEELNEASKDASLKQKRLEMAEEKICEEQSEIDILKATIDKMNKTQRESEIKNMNETDKLHAEVAILQAKLESGRKEMKAQLKEKEQSYKLQISKEKKKAECYKEKAIDAHTKQLQVKALLLHQKGKLSDLNMNNS